MNGTRLRHRETEDVARRPDRLHSRHREPTQSDAHRRIVWHLEVWGKLRGRADFQHVYAVNVLPPGSRAFDDDHV